MFTTADEVARLQKELAGLETELMRKYSALSAYAKKRAELLKEATVIATRIAEWDTMVAVMKTESKVVLLSEYQSVTNIRSIDVASHEQMMKDVAAVDQKAKDTHKNLIPAIEASIRATKANLARAEAQLERENNNVLPFRR